MKTYSIQSTWVILLFSFVLSTKTYPLIAQDRIDSIVETLIYMSPEDKLLAKKLGLDLPNYQFNDLTTNNHIIQGLYYNTRAKRNAIAGGICLGFAGILTGGGLAGIAAMKKQDDFISGTLGIVLFGGIVVSAIIPGIISLVTFSQSGHYKSKCKNEIKSANSYKFN